MSTGALQDGYDGLLLDLDGVVYIGSEAVPGAVPALARSAAAGLRLGYVTNNAARPAVQVSEHLRALGLQASPQDVVTSAQVAAAMVRDRLGESTRVLCVGGPGIAVAVEAEGMTVVPSALERPDAVVQGFGPDLRWRDLAEAAYAVQAGALWVATNTDLTIPQPRGPAPGCGSLVNAVREAVDVDPLVAGKPEPVAFTTAARRLGATRPLVIGDRLDTDIQGGVAAGFDTMCVLTGIHGVDDLIAAGPDRRPTYICATLDALHEPWPQTDLGDEVARVGAVQVRRTGGVLDRVTGQNPVHALNAAVHLLWAAADSGSRCEMSPELGALVRSARPNG